MSDFKRRPFMAGHTDVFIMSQPFITGTEHLNSDARLDSIETIIADATAAGTTPPIIELSIQTEAGDADWQLDLGTASEADRTLAAIVDNINSLYGPASVSPLIQAFDFEGCLRIQSLGSGYVVAESELAYVKILPSQSGLEDAAPLFGFPRDPHPEATVTAGDLAHAPGRPLTQVNRPGVAFLARGEDRVSQNFNRALHQLGINDDSLNTRLKTRVPVPTVIDIPRGSSRLKFDASGHIVAVDLSSGYADAIDGIITATSRVFVGGLTNSSSLLDIAETFSVQDQDDNQIQADERVVRVGAVVNGYLIGATVPTFASEGSSPSGSLPDATTYAPDHGNLLGVQITKTAATVITAVEDSSVIVCDSATFTTDGVKAGDVVTISGSTLNAPINHNGDYIVETVVSDTRLVVRPADHNSVHLLNESESANLGSATVKTDGNFAENCTLFFSPPLADYPPDRIADDGSTTISGVLRIVLGTESFLGEVPHQFLTKSTIMTSAEMDAFVSRRIWRRMSFDGIYQGQSYDYRASRRGGGAEGRITDGPITFDIQSQQSRVTGVSVASGSGTLEVRGKDLVVSTAAGTVLADTDIGKVIYITDTAGTLLAAKTPFLISEFLSYREVRVTPPVDYKDWRTSDLVGSTAISFEIADDGQASLQAAMLFVANDQNFDEQRSSKTGSVFIRNHRDGSDNDVSPGTSFLHLERVRHVQTGPSGATTSNARFLTVTVNSATAVTLSVGSDTVHPEWNMNMFYSRKSAGGVRESNGVGCTILRIVNGPNAGFYELYDHDTNTGQISVAPIENAFDKSGSISLNTSTGITEVGNLYNVVFAAGGVRSVKDGIYGTIENVTSGITAYADSSDKAGFPPGADNVSRAIQAHWNGEGSALHVVVNDPDFYAYSFSNQNAATGYALDIRVYNPAHGGYIRALSDFDSSTTSLRVARALRLFTDSAAVDRQRESTDPEAATSTASGAALEAASRYADPAAKVLAGTAEDSLHTKLFPGGPRPDTSASALVIMDNRYADGTGHTVDTATDPINVPQGLRIGAASITGSVTLNRESPILSMSPVLSSASAPLYAVRTSNSTGSITPTENPNWSVGSYSRTLFEDSTPYPAGGRWGGQYSHLAPLWSDAFNLPLFTSNLGMPEVDLAYPTAGATTGSITLSAADYSIFQNRHEYVVSLPVGQLVFVAFGKGLPEELAGRILWISVDDGTGSGSATHSYLFRIEAVVVSSGIKLALFANDEGASRPDLTTQTIISMGVKASRWNTAYIDIAESMMIGTRFRTGADVLDQVHLPVLTLLRSSPFAASSAASFYDVEKSGADLGTLTYTDGTVATVIAANLGLYSDNVVSLSPSGYFKFSFFEDLPTVTTDESLWMKGIVVTGGLAGSVDGYTVGSPFGQFFLGGNATWEEYDSSSHNIGQWNVTNPSIDLASVPEADRDAFDNGFFFESITASALNESRINGELTSPMSVVSHRVQWSPHRDGSLAIVNPSTNYTTNLFSGTRIWVPIGRSFTSEYLSVLLQISGSFIIDSKFLVEDYANVWNNNPNFRACIRKSDDSILAVTTIRLALTETTSTTGLTEYSFSGDVDLHAGLAASSYSENGLGGKSPVFREEGSLNPGRTETNEPLFVTIDFFTLRISDSETLDSDLQDELYLDLVNTTEHTPVIPLPTDGTTNGRLIISGIQVTDIRPPIHITSSAVVGGSVTANNFRFRDPITQYHSYGPESVQFHTGLRYSNACSTMYAFGTKEPLANNTSPRPSLSLIIQNLGTFSGGNTKFGFTSFYGLGPICGMLQPMFGVRGSKKRNWGVSESEIDSEFGSSNPNLLRGLAAGQDTIMYALETNSSVSTATWSSESNGNIPNSFSQDFVSDLQPPAYMGGTYATVGSDVDQVWINQELGWVQITHDQSLQFRRGLSGASIVGHHSNDPLWYQCESLSARRGSSRSPLIKNVRDGYDLVSNSSADMGSFAFFGSRVVMPGPTGFLVPISAEDGSILTEFSWHVSISPRVWVQDLDIWWENNETPGYGNYGSLNGGATLPAWAREYKQADWGIYYFCPQSTDGVTTSTNVFGLTQPANCLSHSVAAWNSTAGFVVDIYRQRIGSSTDSASWTNFENLEEHTNVELIHSRTVNLSSLDTQPYDAINSDFPSGAGTLSRTGIVYQWAESGTVLPTNQAHEKTKFINECHIKGTESLNLPIDRSQYTYFAVIRAYVTGDRLFTSLNSVGSDDNYSDYTDGPAGLYWYSEVDRSETNSSLDYLPGIWQGAKRNTSGNPASGILKGVWNNSAEGTLTFSKSASCVVGINPYGIPAHTRDSGAGNNIPFGDRRNFVPPTFTFRAARTASKKDKP